MFFKISQSSQENTGVGVFFLSKSTLSKRRLAKFLRIPYSTPPDDCFCLLKVDDFPLDFEKFCTCRERGKEKEREREIFFSQIQCKYITKNITEKQYSHIWKIPYGCRQKLLTSFDEWKQPFRGVLRKRCSENIHQIYGRTPMPNCDFNKVAKQLY